MAQGSLKVSILKLLDDAFLRNPESFIHEFSVNTPCTPSPADRQTDGELRPSVRWMDVLIGTTGMVVTPRSRMSGVSLGKSKGKKQEIKLPLTQILVKWKPISGRSRIMFVDLSALESIENPCV